VGLLLLSVLPTSAPFLRHWVSHQETFCIAQIRKRGPSQYQARVRIKGYPEAVRTFKSKADAVLWASGREQLLLQGLGDALREAERLPLSSALTRYSAEVTPRKKGASSENNRIKVWLRNPLASQLSGVVVHLDRDEARYENAYSQLNAMLIAAFGKKVNIPKLTPPGEYQYENLPALPASIQDYLATVPPSLD